MKRSFLSCLILVCWLSTVTHAQFTAGAMAGIGHLSQRQESNFATYSGLDPAQPLLMAGLYGQYNQKGVRGFLGGLQLRYQSQRQAQRFSAMNPSDPFELTSPIINRYGYLIATPYVGIQPLNHLEIAAGPEISLLLHGRTTSTLGELNCLLFGYNIKATYWLGRFGIEGGYSRQSTAYDSRGSFTFYNRFVYGAVKYALIR